MEGYLLVFTKERAAQIWYCVLETGLIKCYDSHVGGATLIDCIELTRHRVHVKPLIGGNVCPNRFVLHATEVKRNDQVGKLAAVALREKTHVFATATSDKMCKWVNAIHNWRRHTFDDPLGMFAGNDGDDPAVESTQQSRRRAELELDRLNVINLASRFDIRLARCKPAAAKSKNKTRFPRISPISSIGEAAARKVLLLRPSRASGVITSWLPTFASSHEKRNTIS